MSETLVSLPIVIPLAAAFAALLLRQYAQVQGLFTLAALLASLLASLLLLLQVQAEGAMVLQLGSWPVPFGITLVGDMLSAFMVVMCQFVLVMGALYAVGAKDKCIRYPSFYPLFLTLAAGLTGAMLTGDVFNLFVFAELLVISGAALTAMSDDRLGIEAAYKYFYISLTAAWFLLLAVGSLYVSYGTLNMADLALSVAADPDRPLLTFAIIMLFAAFMVKSAVVPFHFWQPDFHTVSPTAVSAMLSSVVVKLGIYGFLRMTTLLFVEQAVWIRGVLIVLGVVGVLLGGYSAIGTHNAKRMLAYSTLAQIGFILVAIGWGTPLALAAALIFTFNHSLIKSALLMLAGFVASRAPIKTADFANITGVGRNLPQAGGLFFVGGLALAGIPPTNGFLSKMMVFQSGLQTEDFVTLAIIGVASIMTLVYVMRAFMQIWWQAPAPGATIKSTGDRLVAPAILILFVLIFGIWVEPLMRVVTETSAWMSDPQLYISAVMGG